MSLTRTLFAPAVGLALLAGCSNDAITGIPHETSTEPRVSAAAHAAIQSVDGEWNWSSVEEVAFPPFLAAMLGVVPEGHLTRARCESSGPMTLQQSGTLFEGTAEKSTNICMTTGGQPFTQPATLFTITDGKLAGKTLHFSFSSATVTPCPHRAIVTAADAGVAVALSGKGRCILPGHPRSESPLSLDPPPQGQSRTVAWEAVRP